jgi:transcriptional regulator with XRE-family HTH domain
MTIAQRVRDQRYAKGWGPDELASRAEISRTALYQIECGRTESPRAATLSRIARALGVPIEALLGQEPREAEAGPRGGRVATAARGLSPASYAANPALHQKLDDLLGSPFGEGITQIVLESHRLLDGAGGPARG